MSTITTDNYNQDRGAFHSIAVCQIKKGDHKGRPYTSIPSISDLITKSCHPMAIDFPTATSYNKHMEHLCYIVLPLPILPSGIHPRLEMVNWLKKTLQNSISLLNSFIKTNIYCFFPLYIMINALFSCTQTMLIIISAAIFPAHYQAHIKKSGLKFSRKKGMSAAGLTCFLLDGSSRSRCENHPYSPESGQIPEKTIRNIGRA